MTIVVIVFPLSSDGTIVAIGAITNDANGSNSGHVRVYQYTDNNWQQLGSDIDGEATDDNSGYSVSLSADGTIVAIGAPKNDGSVGSNSGHVRIYQYTNNNWQQLGSDIGGTGAAGWSCSLSSDGTIVAIGAVWNDNNGNDSGHCNIYQYTNNNWQQLGSDIDGEYAGDQSGWSCSLSSDGTIVAISSIFNSDNRTHAGHVRVYQYTDNNWQQLGSGY